MEDTAVIFFKKYFFFCPNTTGSLGKRMEKKNRGGGVMGEGARMVLICFLKAGGFSSSLNDRHKK